MNRRGFLGMLLGSLAGLLGWKTVRKAKPPVWTPRRGDLVRIRSYPHPLLSYRGVVMGLVCEENPHPRKPLYCVNNGSLQLLCYVHELEWVGACNPCPALKGERS